MEYGINSRDLGVLPYKELAEEAARLGYKSIQLAVYDTILELQGKKKALSTGLAKKIKKAFDNAGVRIAALECFINPVHPDEITRQEHINFIKEHIRFATDFDCRVVTTESGSKHPGFLFHEDNHKESTFEELVEVMESLVKEAEQHNVLLCIEGCSALVIHTPEKMERLLGRIDSSNLQVLFDPVDMLSINNWMTQEAVIEESFERFGERINLIHAKDFIVEEDRLDDMVQAGDGVLNYQLLMSLIQQHKSGIDVIMEDVKKDRAQEGIDYINTMRG